MSDIFDALTDAHTEFIGNQHLFFVATAAPEGRVNLSPKGMDSFRVLGPNRIAWLNVTGSGNETAAHVLESNRMTIMFCSFDKKPLILRLYGQATMVYPRDSGWPALAERFPALPGARQIFELDVDLVQGSCGYAVPHYDFIKDRPTLKKWATASGDTGIEAFQEKHNLRSLDDKETGIF